MASKSVIEDETALLASRLEQEAIAVYNISAMEYLSMLHRYLNAADIHVIPVYPQNSVLDESIDKSVGIEWMVVIPLVYFMSIILILGLILGYILFMASAKKTQECSQISIPFSRRRDNATQGRELSVHYTANSVETNLQSMASASSNLSSWFSFLGAQDSFGEDKPALDSQYKDSKAERSVQTGSLCAKRLNFDVEGPPGKSPVLRDRASCTPSSWLSFTQAQSLSSLKQAFTTSMSPESLEMKSHDSLRMSTEYHKLVWGSGGDILPDRLYGTDDEEIADAKGTKASDTDAKSAKDKKLQTSSKGVHTSASKTVPQPLTLFVEDSVSTSEAQSQIPQHEKPSEDRWSCQTPSISDLTEFPFMADDLNPHIFHDLYGSYYINPIFTGENRSDFDEDVSNVPHEAESERPQEEESAKYLNIDQDEGWSQDDVTTLKSSPGTRGSKDYLVRNVTPLDFDDTSSLSDNMAVGDPIGDEYSDFWPRGLARKGQMQTSFSQNATL